jgi:c(7)-type cytochrome triheme protein
MKKTLFISCILLASAAVVFAQTGMKKKRPLPDEFGRVVITSRAGGDHMVPVVFEHWLHRSMFTCRVCHVDIGFAMKANATGIQNEDIEKGFYCGSCHNGKFRYNNETVFSACSSKSSVELTDEERRNCDRCHSQGKVVSKKHDFRAITANLPKERFGNGVDWEKAEKEKRISLVDYIEGVSIKRKAMDVRKDFSIAPNVKGMPEIIFSHEKHTVWNGCEVCHPEIFMVKKGQVKYTMVDIFEGEYCGVCHGKVAFPMMDCQRCHTQPVQ